MHSKTIKNLKIAVFLNFLDFSRNLHRFGTALGAVLGPKISESGSKKPIKTQGFSTKSGLLPLPKRLQF